MKTHQVKESSTTAKVQVRNFIYTVKAYPDFTLDARFAQQVRDIADAIENNQTKNADYLSEMMVREYGTHVINSVDAGAALVQEDYLCSSYVSNNESESSSVKAQAGLNFFDKLKSEISSQSAQQSSLLQTYQSKITYSLINSHGGAPFYPGITLQKWQESTRNNLVAIDRSGFPLHYIINMNTLPDLSYTTIGKVALTVSQAIQRYYDINSRPGCVDTNSKNFNFQANMDDNSCEGPATSLSFGGVYQECSEFSLFKTSMCKDLSLNQVNPDTGDFSCHAPYSATLLRTEMRSLEGFNSVTVSTYWCFFNGQTSENSGYLFGGIYSPSLLNPLTKSKSCPPNFIPLTFLSDGEMICVSKDYETGTRFSVPFGGFFSCQSTNPLANNQRRCPPKFSQHLAAISDGCEILYCVQSELFTGGELQPIRLPPFTKPPLISMQANNTVMVMTEGENSWVRVGQTKKWKLAKPEEINCSGP